MPRVCHIVYQKRLLDYEDVKLRLYKVRVNVVYGMLNIKAETVGHASYVWNFIIQLFNSSLVTLLAFSYHVFSENEIRTIIFFKNNIAF